MEKRIDFRLRVAELTAEVSCLYPSTRGLCREYLTEEAAEISVTITEEELARERLRLKEEASGPAVESLVLCRALAERLPLTDRVLFHGSCLAFEGQGVLFTAKSGTGKSTHARIWRQEFGGRVTMINDDKPFLKIGQEVIAYGSPWTGKHRLGSSSSAPLKAVCVLCRGTENKIEALNPRQALPLILQQTYAPRDPVAMARTLALADRLCRSVPMYRLTCNMDPEAAHIALAGMNLRKEGPNETV